MNRKGFTLIELLIVVAIIAVLAAIAVPNFLEAQVRAKTARVGADLRNIAVAVESYRVDNGDYPEGTDDPTKYPEHIGQTLGPLAKGYYSFRTRGANGMHVGTHFAGITTPIAYIQSMPGDPFAPKSAVVFTYCYRNAKDRKNGWILSSAGPDNDLLAPQGVGTTNSYNPLSTAVDNNLGAGLPARLADINERQVINFIEGTPKNPATAADIPLLRQHLADLTYDPTNGSVSDGDLWRVGP